MTTYFTKVTLGLAWAYGLPRKVLHSTGDPQGARVLLLTQSRVDFDALDDFRGVHVLRDPRDMIVSSYHYHKWAPELWLDRPDEVGVSYREKLLERDQRTGLFMEIDHFAYMNRDTLRAWPIDDPRILEVRYEDLMGPNRASQYERIFTHLGLPPEGVAFGCDLMQLFEIERRRGKGKAVEEKSHLRSGKSGQWQNVLEPEHLARIDELFGPEMEKFGFTRQPAMLQGD